MNTILNGPWINTTVFAEKRAAKKRIDFVKAKTTEQSPLSL